MPRVAYSGVRALGPKGRYVVGVLALSEFFGGSCIMLVVVWRELVGMLPAHSVSPSIAFTSFGCECPLALQSSFGYLNVGLSSI